MADESQQLERAQAALEGAEQALAEALDARASAVKALAELKAASPDVYFALPSDPQVIAHLAERVQVFPKTAVGPVMTEVLSACARMVAKLEVAYVGQEGGFGHLAARKQFGSSAVLRGVDSAEEALSEVERGRASFAIVPFETSNDGAVTASLNLLARSDAKVCAEIKIRRAFHLISQSGDRKQVQKIYATSSAIAACDTFLRERFPDAVVIDCHNAVIAAEHAKTDPAAAALVTDFVQAEPTFAYVERSIEELADLETRYVAIGNDFPSRTGRDRTAVAIALHDAPGVLIECLRPFSDRKLNIYRLETRPARGWAFRYLILLEVDGHITDRPVLAAIEELRTQSRYVKVLGSYPITEA
jgi:chorismate mutase / prephenate dehydratase